jgi:hypothetical protein
MLGESPSRSSLFGLWEIAGRRTDMASAHHYQVIRRAYLETEVPLNALYYTEGYESDPQAKNKSMAPSEV